MYYVIVIFFVALLFVFILFLTSLAGAVVYIAAIPFIKYFERRKRIGEVGIERIQFGLSFVVIVVAIHQTYRAFYPADSFYEGEYETITSRELPSSGSVEKKSSSYPDLHGDYCSASIITLSTLHWRDLLSQIEQDSKFELGKPGWSSVLVDVIGKETEYEFNGFERNDRKSDIHEYIGFIESGSKLLLTRCVV